MPAAWDFGTHCYRWRHRFGAMEAEEVRRLRELERENARLKRRVAERDPEINGMRELPSKKPYPGAKPGGVRLRRIERTRYLGTAQLYCG